MSIAALQSSVTQYGITWMFDKAYEVGQYVTGDYWVVGPVKVVSITNSWHTHGFSPTADQDGSMVNPPTTGTQGYDNTVNGYTASLNVGKSIRAGIPLNLAANSSLVSTVSWLYSSETNTEPGCPSFNGGTGTPRPVLRDGAVLTCVATAPAAGSFRPPYCGNDKTAKYTKADLNYSLLGNLTPPPVYPQVTILENAFARPWLDHFNGYMGGFVHPSENMPQYGQDMSNLMGEVALALHLDFSKLPGSPSKEKTLIGLVQWGIDLKAIVDNGGFWECNGGHASGRKWPILFAGLMLNDTGMKNIGQKSGDYLYSGSYGAGNEPPDYVYFGEDDQTFYVKDADIYPTPYERHEKSGFVWYGHGNPGKKKDYLEYESKHKGLPEWGIRHATDPNRDGLDWGNASYRTCCTGGAWGGFVLAAHIMNATSLWNHDALFDYVDRYIEIETKEKGLTSAQDRLFVVYTWNTYRKQYGGVWKRSDPNDLYSTGTRDYSSCVYNCTRVEDRMITMAGRSEPSAVSVSPNPMQDQAIFSIPFNNIKQVTIFDQAGNTVYQTVGAYCNTPLQWHGMDIAGQPVKPGVYFYSVTSDGQTWSGRIVKAR
jgi:hypothetical protein